MKIFIETIALPILGLFTVIAGFVYDVIFAGIPYQDTTPELQSRWEFHKSIEDMFYKFGGIVLLVGVQMEGCSLPRRTISHNSGTLLPSGLTVRL